MTQQNMHSILVALLKENTNHPEIKEILKIQTTIREKLTYYGLTASPDTYLQAYGISYHNNQEFNFIGQIIHSKTTSVLARIKRSQLQVNTGVISQLYQKIYQRQRQVLQVSPQIQAQVQHVLKNVDLPLSLFKRNDRYWSSDNPKTIEAKQYLQKLKQNDRQWKKNLKEKREQIISKKIKAQQDEINQMKKNEQQQQKLMNQHRKMKIKQLQAKAKQREKKIKQSEEYYKSLKPMFKQIEKNYQQKYEIPLLEERKKKLQEVRQLRRSIDLTQIEEHNKKLKKIEAEHQPVKIKNQPLKVGFKSKFYQQNSQSMRENSLAEKTIQSLYEKKINYGKSIKEKHPPTLNEQLVQQMEQRLKAFKRKRVRVNKKQKVVLEQPVVNSDDEDNEEDEEEEEQEQEQEVKKQQPKQQQNQSDDSENEDDDQSKKEQNIKVRGDDEDVTRQQRKKIGDSYLQYVRKLRKKQKSNEKIIDNNNEEKKNTKYKDYLRQMVRTSKTLDNTASLNKQLNQNKESGAYNTSIQRKMRKVYEQAIYQQQLLKVEKNSHHQKIKKKYQIDDAVVSTIKARLALMKQ